jgi:DNA modification methylase
VKTTHRIFFGDARRMSRVSDGSAHLVITSPPYWQLKDYGNENQIGFHDSYEEYINNLNLAWLECYRVLHDGCRLCINIGDQFARSVYYGRYKVIPIRTEITRFCETIGLDFMGSIIWQKVTTCNTTGGATIMGSYPYPRNGIVKIDYEFILLFKKPGKSPKVTSHIKAKSELSKVEWNQFFNGHWNFPGEKQAGHIAMFPEELPRRLIKMFSFVGDTVLDPFMGSGTTSLAAMKLGRNSIGYEINGEFRKVIEEKLEGQSDLFGNASVEYETDDSVLIEDTLSSLPYRFKDPLSFNKRTDPRKLRFGSRISSKDETGKRNNYHRVKDVISVDKVALDNGLLVRLLGVAPIKDHAGEALEFLLNKVKGKQVYLKYDTVKHDESDNLLVYMYLKNRTFINAHLIKYGLASIDRTFDITNRTLLRYSE